MRKIILGLILFLLILNQQALAALIPDGSGGFFGDVYNDYYYLDPNLNALIQEVLDVATVTPPTEGVPVFPYDPILYYLLIRGFGLDTAVQQKLNQNLLKSQLQDIYKTFTSDLKNAWTLYEEMSYRKAITEVVDTKDDQNKEIAKWLNDAAIKTRIVSIADNLQNYFSCHDPDFASINRNFITSLAGRKQLGTYAGIKFDEINFCEIGSSLAQAKQTYLVQKKKSLLANIISGFVGRLIVAQVNENISETTTAPAIIITDASDYSYRDLLNYQKLNNLKTEFQNSYGTPGSSILNQYVRIEKCIRDDDGRLYPDFSSIEAVAANEKENPVLTSDSVLNVFKTRIPDIDEKMGFLNFVARNFIKNQDFNIYSFNNGTDFLTYIYNQCKGQVTSVSQFNSLDKANPYSDCVKGYIRTFVLMYNHLVNVLKAKRETIENLRTSILEPIINKFSSDRGISGSLEDKVRYINAIYLEKSNQVNTLQTISVPSHSCGNLGIYSCYGKFFNNYYLNLTKVRNILEGGVSGSDYPYSVSAFIHYLLAYALKAKDMYDCKVSNAETYYAKKQPIYKIVKVKKQITYPQITFNPFNFLSNIFKPKEVNLIFKK